MKTMTATDIVRNFRHVLDVMERNAEEITIVRNNKPVARIIPGVPCMSAIEVLGDLYRTIEPDEGKRWLDDAGKINRHISGKVRDPWR